MSKVGQWFKGLSKTGQVAVVSGAVLLGLGTVSTLAEPGGTATPTQEPNTTEQAPKEEPKPVIAYKEVSEEEAIPHSSKTVNDADLIKGVRETRTLGVDGVRTKTYRLTLTDGEETDRKLIKNTVTTAPVTEVVAIGTYVKPASAPTPSCDPNYSGACVPIASDVDCGGGSGNGPAYVYSTVIVVGSDIYDLDRDSNGYGCE